MAEAPLAARMRPRSFDEFLGQAHLIGPGKALTKLLSGFDIELVAPPTLVPRPISADFDEQGRLYVTDSSGSNEKVDLQLQKKPHRVLRLEDTDGDGRFDKCTVFAEGLMFPEGIMYYQGSVYVAAPPSIWKLTDTDGDGKADKREEWFNGKTLTGCANDLHGPYLGPDGWIYWCKGAFAKQTYERPGKKPFNTRASHIFRCKPDGSGLEHVMTGGMDNPVDVVFTPGGERIFTTTFFQFPGGGQRDGLIHNVYGGVYGKDWDVIHDHPWTSPAIMPVLTHLGPAAPCGLTRVESAGLGKDYQDNLFTAVFNLRKVTRHVLKPHGATFTSHDSDFVVSDNHDFHPTDVVEDADGSLLIVDTGGWYKLCCPTSQLRAPDILGGIYRVRRQGAERVADPRGLKLPWPKLPDYELAPLLGDPRPAVRRRAVEALTPSGKAAIPWLKDVLQKSPVLEARRQALWTAARIDHPDARALVRKGLADPDETVRQVALHVVGLWRDRAALAEVQMLLRSQSLHNRRAAAEALGRIGDQIAVPALLVALAEPSDRFLEHSLTYALIEIANQEDTALGLIVSPSPHTRRAVLTALEQMENGGLKAETVLKELSAAEPRLKETAWWIASRHPEWGGKLASFLRARLNAKNLPASEEVELVQQLAKLAKSAAVQELLAGCLKDAAAGPAPRRLALRAMAQSTLREAPELWLVTLTPLLTSAKDGLLEEAVKTCRSLRLPKKIYEPYVQALGQIGQDGKASVLARLQALAALPGGLAKVEPDLFGFLLAQAKGDQPVALRGLAADVLNRARLDGKQLLALAASLKTASPMELDRLLEPFAKTNDDKVGQCLLDALQASPAKTSLRPDSLKPRLAKYSPAIQKQAEQLYASLDAEAGKQQERLEQLLKSLPPGDIQRGRAVFNNPKAACISCHAIGYVGGKIGPDLTRIGGIRSDRDLLEAIVFPNASFVRGYESFVIATADGKAVNGILKQDGVDEIVLTINADQEVRISRGSIEEMRPSRVSIMPSGLEQQLSLPELADLVAFLKACK